MSNKTSTLLRCIKPYVPDLYEFNGIMLVGDVPGVDGQKTGQPLMGDAGKHLNSLLHYANVVRERCVITTVFHVQPHHNLVDNFFEKLLPGHEPVCFLEHPYNNRYLLEDLKPEIQRLHSEISFAMPHLKVIVALGSIALWALTGRKGITAHRGTLLDFDMQGGGCLLMPTFHPSYLMKSGNPVWDQHVINDLRLAAKAAESAK